MKCTFLSRVIGLCTGLAMLGCMSSFEPRMLPGAMESPRLPNAKSVQAGVEVAVEEYHSSHKSRRAFDADLGASGVIPLLVFVENKSGQTYHLRREWISAVGDGYRLTNLYGLDAAETAALRDPTWNALVNTAAIGPLAIFFGVATMAASANQTQKINRQIEQHFERMELRDREVKPNESAAGFIFFRAPTRSGIPERLDIEVRLASEPVEDRPGKHLDYQLALPLHDLKS